ncbi:MAG TPA: AMP-binding protein [Terriglobales bacterium]|nr:AMP-binding protein [Terriglobales bacterium]
MNQPYLLQHLLEQAAMRAPAAEAVVDLAGERRSFNYETLYRTARSCASVLQQQGLERLDRVAVFLPKSAEEAAAIFAATMAGGVFVSVNTALLAPQVAHILADCGVKYLVTSRQGWQKICGEVTNVRSLRCLLLLDDHRHEIDAIDAVANVFRQDGELRSSTAIGEDLAGILYTSGSTGKPRGVMLSHRNLLAGARIVSTYLELSSADRLLSVVPFSFDYGLNQLLTTVQYNAAIVLLHFRFPFEIVRALKEESITGFAGVPLIWAGLIHHMSGLRETTLTTLRYITNTGGCVPTSTVRTLRELLPNVQIVLMYGLTEAFRSTYLPPAEVDRRPNSIGKAIPETEILVIGPDGKPCQPGEVGTLVHRGPTVSLGYWGKPELTSEVIRPHPLIPLDQGGGMVCYSGDLVKTDDEGFIYYIARADGQIKSQGYRISPAEVEEALMEGGELSAAAVIGLPAAEAGENVHAIVVPISSAALNADQILGRCAVRLPSYMVPKSIEVVNSLPKTPNGKIDYKSLRAARVRQDQ